MDTLTEEPEHPVDLQELTKWLDLEGIGDGPITDVRTVGGGTQNVMLRFWRGSTELVLRRGPRHLRPGSNASMIREIRVLGALADTDVPHPRLVASCPDPDVLGGAVFYVMRPVAGTNPVIDLPDPVENDPHLRHNFGLAVAEALAKLASVDHEAVGLGDLGKPAGFLQRQVERWRAELDSYGSMSGYPGPDLDGIEILGEWLAANQPEPSATGLIHGDFHLANVMMAEDGGVAAIVDWEMCTLGDPLLDLGGLLVTWPRQNDTGLFDTKVGRAGGLPRREEVVSAYAKRSTRDLRALDWYTAMAGFKLGIILEGTYARSCAGLAPPKVGEKLHAAAGVLLGRAREAAAS